MNIKKICITYVIKYIQNCKHLMVSYKLRSTYIDPIIIFYRHIIISKQIRNMLCPTSFSLIFTSHTDTAFSCHKLQEQPRKVRQRIITQSSRAITIIALNHTHTEKGLHHRHHPNLVLPPNPNPRPTPSQWLFAGCLGLGGSNISVLYCIWCLAHTYTI